MTNRLTSLERGIIVAVAFSGILINAYYASDNLLTLLDSTVSLQAQLALATTAAFETGWVLLLFWFLFDQAQRRGVLLLSILPILLASSAYSLLYGEEKSVLIINMGISLSYCGLYIYAYRLSGYLHIQRL